MTTIAVTGAAGYIGRVLLEQLASDARVVRVVGIDIAEPSMSTRNLEFYRMDVRSHTLADAFRGCDAVVHLAAVATDDADETRDVNIGGTRTVADAAARAGTSKLIFASSHSVYGAHPDNDYPLTEESLVRPAHDNPYAVSKAEAETVVSYYAQAHPDVTTTILRLGWVCGPTLPTRNAAVIDSKMRFLIRGYSPPMQVVHEADAAGALAFAVFNDAPGKFNVCADDTVDQPERILGQRTVTLDPERARRTLDRTSRMGLSVKAADIGVLMYPQVMSNEALRTAGFIPAHSSAEALTAAAEARSDWVALGKLRFRPRRIALVGGTLGAVLVGSRVRSRRTRREKARGSGLLS